MNLTTLALLIIASTADGIGAASAASSHTNLPVLMVRTNSSLAVPNPLGETNLPILAVWRDGGGFRLNATPKRLRLAIWEDGRVVFSRNPNTWSDELYVGRISETAVTELKNGLQTTGVFDLPGHCYLVPDAPIFCTMIAVGERQQLLYWDEVESSTYGININPEPHHLAFKTAWWEVNKLGIRALPSEATRFGGEFTNAPNSWRLKQPIQSR